jgi:apolipoprotein N-acyltransferase
MDSALSYRRCIEAALAALSTAVLFYFGNGLDPIWPLMWFATIPILLFSLRGNAWATAATAVAAMMLGSLNLLGYFNMLGMPSLIWMMIFLVAGVIFAAAVLLFRALVLRGAVWSGLLAPAALWVTFEYLRNLGTPHGSAGSLAYSQLQFLPFLQLASLTGPWGMSFVMLLFSAALALGLHLRATSPRLALRIVGVGTGVWNDAARDPTGPGGKGWTGHLGRKGERNRDRSWPGHRAAVSRVCTRG